MAKDPICGMTVDESSPFRAERDGQTFYFCSEHCRKKFIGQAQPVEATAGAPVGPRSELEHLHEHCTKDHSRLHGTSTWQWLTWFQR